MNENFNLQHKNLPKELKKIGNPHIKQKGNPRDSNKSIIKNEKVMWKIKIKYVQSLSIKLFY